MAFQPDKTPFYFRETPFYFERKGSAFWYFFVLSHSVMAISFENIEKDIAKGDLKPVYLLCGDEFYYPDLLSKKFENELLDEQDRDFNMSVFYGKDASCDKIIEAAKQYPVMASRRLVMLKEAQTMDKRELAKLESYVTKPLASTVLVIVNNGSGFPPALANKINKTGVVFDCKKIKEDKIPLWIESFVRQKGFSIEPQAVKLISDYIGNNLMNISNELSKLMIDLSGRRQITPDDVASHIGISKEYNVFELQKAVGRLDFSKADKCVSYMIANPKENPFQVIIATLFAYFSKILIVSQLGEKTPSAVASAIKVPSFFASDYIAATNVFPMWKLINNISLIREYDMKSKGVGLSPFDSDADLLRELVFKLMH